MKRLLIFLALLLPIVAGADTLEVTVRHPTTNSDGSAIPATGSLALSFWRIEYGSCRGDKFGRLKSWQVLPVPLSKATFTQVQRKTACNRVYWYNNAGGQSAPAVRRVRV